MKNKTDMGSKATLKAAADWTARLGGAPGEADWLEFEQWLNAAPGHRAAYDRALALSLSVEQDGPVLTDRMSRPDAARRRNLALWGGSGLSVALAAAFAVVVLQPQLAAKPTLYATGKGERRDVVLADGTRVTLNADTRLSVLLKRDRRDLTLASGEAAFQVVHDPSRPFTVQAGDRVLQDVGTDFDVKRQGGLLTVSVREGEVAVLRPQGAPNLSLGAGGHLEHREGGADQVTATADADDAFAWRSGRLIYRDRPLSDVAADLSRYGGEEIRADGAAANLRFSGVLTIDNQDGMVGRLTRLLPVVASDRKDGVIVLSELNTSR